MALTHDLDDRTLVTSLRSTVCPACGGAKKGRQTLCLADYRRLPGAMRTALYARLCSGYREAVIEAMNFLGAAEFRMPEAK